MTDFWPSVASDLAELLGDEDDRAFWQAALERIVGETEEAAAGYCGREAILLRVGRCSHWIMPHNKRPSGMAYPYGYGNNARFAYYSLPEFDWSLQWARQPGTGAWVRTKGQPTRRPLVHRIALPARTTRHPRAAVHTIWLPGTPAWPDHKQTLAYGFEKGDTGWECVDHWTTRPPRRFSRCA